ncbi:DNA repair endonuclease XPF-like isoform X2 [Varroa destructor]|uniref:DNA repair endonuclease XPF n=1 Tax=Varroa destructor TaxID=109461 RepID=A0A7M7J4E0_VARDE|nr:DNA repair endonuclease XPF-like isoform X2 [Varroa destructor]
MAENKISKKEKGLDKSKENLAALVEATPLLEYHKEALTEIIDKDALLITARGLGIHEILHSLIRVYHAPENLVIILGTETDQEIWIRHRLERSGMKNTPKWITSDAFDVPARTKLYKEGGVLFVTSRILIGDLLHKRLPAEHVTGFIINNAETVQHSQQDMFILRLYRDKNRTGFVKALSSCAAAFTQDFMQLNRIMPKLFVRHLLLYPRFHQTVKDDLAVVSPTVYETSVPLTTLMEQIQFALMELIEITIRDIKKLNQTLNIEELNTNNVLGKSFFAIIRTYIDPQWHLLSSRVRRSIGDLRNLKKMIDGVTCYDPVTYLHLLRQIWAHRSHGHEGQSDWAMMDAAESLYQAAERRVFRKKENKKDSIKTLKPELCPKWLALAELLRTCEPQGAVVVLVEEERIRKQLEEYLCLGEERVHRTAYQKLFAETEENVDFPEEERVKTTAPENSLSPTTFLVSVSASNPFAFEELLVEVRPRSVILFDLHLSAVRTVEVYQAMFPQTHVELYTLMYVKSVDEQRYLNAVQKEKVAFTTLIQEKASMASRNDWDNEMNIDRGESKVIVDVREFRSDLPSLVHKRGVDLCPGTLEVGDYILTPAICVERKALQDLIDSLCSGRLYRQAERMSLHYETPVVLIEFSTLEAFSFKNKLQSEMIQKKTITRLVMLTIQFPKLRLLWSPTPHATAELFELLKTNKPQPSLEEALKITEKELKHEGGSLDRFNSKTMRFLEALPGVGTHTKFKIMRRFTTLRDLFLAEEDVLLDVFESRDKTAAFIQAARGPFERRGKKRPIE